MPEPFAESGEAGRSKADRAIDACEPAPADRPGATRPLRRTANQNQGEAQLERYAYGHHPCNVKNLIPKSRDFR